MKKLLSAALMALACALACAPPALADNFTARDSTGATQTFCSRLYTGAQYPCHVFFGLFGGVPTAVAVDGSGYIGTNVQSSALPTGAATAAAQATNGGKLDTLHADLAALTPVATGQATKASSIPVTLPNDPDYRPSTGTITVADVATTTVSGQSSVNQVTGTPTALSYVVWSLNGHSAATIGATGTFVETMQIEASGDGGTTYVPTTAKILGTGATTSTITGKGVFRVDVTGMTNIRVRATSYSSGTATLALTASNAAGLTQVLNPVRLLGADGLTANSTANPTPIQQVYGPSGITAVTGTAVSNTASSATAALVAHRDAYLVLTGTGSATFTVLFSTNASNYYPEAGGVNGGSPIIANEVAYDGSTQNGIRLPFHTDEYGVTAKVKPGTVTGTVTYSLEQ